MNIEQVRQMNFIQSSVYNVAKFRNLSGSNVILWTSISSLPRPVLQSQSPFHHPPPSTYHRAYWLGSRFTIVHHSCVLARMWHLERLYSTLAPRLKDDTIEISSDSTFTPGRDHDHYAPNLLYLSLSPPPHAQPIESLPEIRLRFLLTPDTVCITFALLWLSGNASVSRGPPRFAWLDRIIKVTVCTFPYFLLVSTTTTTTTTTATTAATNKWKWNKEIFSGLCVRACMWASTLHSAWSLYVAVNHYCLHILQYIYLFVSVCLSNYS